MAESDISVAAPLVASDPRWIKTVLADFDVFLQDHASCEKKASGMAMNVAAHYPDQPALLAAMVDLAVEELNHYREVVKLLLTRQIAPAPDVKDAYVGTLNQQVRRGTENFLLDRLLVGAVVERRGAERFELIAQHLNDPILQAFYQDIALSETRHWLLFVDLASSHCDATAVVPRFIELAAFENELVSTLPLRAALH
ncbi:MAG: tRNA-(ms[2]io[6]A)-hydroxylase [Candidatus Azotimanducaceae bacterium]|jgi:tRNA-(ms[2]io[6]A)-hydroxylase